MNIPPFKQLKLADRVLQQLQANVAEVLAPLSAVKINTGVLASFTTGGSVGSGVDISLGHGLGRVPIGIIALLSLAPSQHVFSLSKTSNPAAKTVALLNANDTLPAGSTFSFWVF